MELNREQIIKALECLTGEEVMFCRECAYNTVGAFSCKKELAKDALSIIKELTEENASLKQCMEHEHSSFMETFGELDDKCKRLTEENERLKKENEYILMQHAFQRRPSGDCWNDVIEKAKADTVRKMQAEIEARCIKGGIYPAFVKSTIDQIAKEMIGEGND